MDGWNSESDYNLPSRPPPEGDFIVFYLRFSFLPRAIYAGTTKNIIIGDDEEEFPVPPPRQMSELSKEQLLAGIGKALKDLKPHIYSVNSAEDVRRAMASIIAELSQK